MANYLRATAAAFTPLSIRRHAACPLDGQGQDEITRNNSGPGSAVCSVSETSSSPSIETVIDCPFCTSIGRLLNCCQARTPLDPCLHCTELGQLLDDENKRHQDEMTALREQFRQLKEETPDEKFSRLCAERNTEIVELKSKVEKMNTEDELLKAEIEGLTRTLRGLEMEIKKAQPVAAFTIKEAKKGKRM